MFPCGIIAPVSSIPPLEIDLSPHFTVRAFFCPSRPELIALYITHHCSMTDVSQIAQTIRHHWAIENQQHWILDVQFGEDKHRTRKDHSAANLGLIRRTALNLLQQDTSNKSSIRRRKMRTNFDVAYREQILFRSPKQNAT